MKTDNCHRHEINTAVITLFSNKKEIVLRYFSCIHVINIMIQTFTNEVVSIHTFIKRSGFDIDIYKRIGFDQYTYKRIGFDPYIYKRIGFDPYIYKRIGFDPYIYTLPLNPPLIISVFWFSSSFEKEHVK